MKSIDIVEDNPGCRCGIPRIVETFEPGSNISQKTTIYPWVVTVYPFIGTPPDPVNDPKFRCTGSIVGKRFVFTAAHCVSRDQARGDQNDFVDQNITRLYRAIAEDPSVIKVIVGHKNHPKSWKEQ